MKIKHTRIASAVTMALMAMVMPARADQAAAAPAGEGTAGKSADALETVVVTGIRGALQQSLAVKRAQDSHVEVLTAEDIGKMPDKNVADSLQRIPGVTISSAGATEGGFDENDRVSMRGTNPSLTQTLVNGHYIASGDWFVLDQVGTVGRSVSYTLLPSELVSQVIVRKSSEASLVEGGVAGSVDIITRKPLDFSKTFTGEVSLGAVYADLPDKTDPQVSALFNWRNEQKTAGVLLQVFNESRHLRRDGIELLGYDKTTIGGASVAVPHDIGEAWFEQTRRRTGGLIDFQVKPSDSLTLDVNGFSSELHATNYNRNYLLWLPHFAGSQAPNPGYVVQNGTLVSAQWSGQAANQYGIYDQISRPDEAATTNFLDLDLAWQATEVLKVNGKFGVSEGHGKTPEQNVAEWDVDKGTGGGYTLNGIGSAPNFNFGTANVTNLSNVAGLDWIFGVSNVDIVDKENWAQLDAIYQVGGDLLSDVKFGVRYSDHTRDNVNQVGQHPGPGAFTAANWPQGYSNYPSDFGSGLGGSFPGSVWYYTQGQVDAFGNAYTARPTDGTREYWPGEFRIKETDTAGYLQGDLEGKGWSGNLGLRLVQTKEHVLNYVGVNAPTPGEITTSAFGPYVLTPVDHTYHDVLPSANLKLDLSKDLLARFAINKTMTRADYSSLAGAVQLGSPPGIDPQTGLPKVGGGSTGNPDLQPIRSTNYDTTLEWYFAPRSLASASLFYMDLQNYVGLGSVNRQFFTVDGQNPAGYLATYDLSIPINSAGTVKGIELAWEQPVFSDFGFAANYTYIDAHEKGGGPLVGASRTTYNLSGYFENENFNARINWSYRSSFYSGLDRSTAFYQDDSATLSASLGYKYSDQLTVSLDARNLNDPTLKYYAQDTSQPRAFYKNGRQYYLTARLQF